MKYSNHQTKYIEK